MAGNTLNILATTAAGGTGTSLAWFAPLGTAGPVAVTYTAEVQTITITGTATALTFTWKGLSTPSQTGTVATATLTTAINTAWAPYLRGGSCTVSGSAGVSYVITFPAAVGNASVISCAATGASAATVETTPGAGANPATAIIPVAYKDAGICEASSGLGIKYNDTTKEVEGFGLSSAARVLFTKSVVTFDVTFLETNHTSLEVYHRLAIGATGLGAVDGYISGVVDGPPLLVSYAGIFDIVDGDNHLRAYCPNVQNTSKGDLALPFGDAVKRPVTLTAFPDSSNNSVYWYPVVGALAGL